MQFHTKCRIFFIRHIVKIRTARHAQCRCATRIYTFFHRILPEFHPADYRFSAPAAESIRRPRGSLQHSFALLKSAPSRVDPFSKICPSAAAPAAPGCRSFEICFMGVCHRTSGIQNLIRLNPFQDFSPVSNRLLMPQIPSMHICRPTDLILHIPDRLLRDAQK